MADFYDELAPRYHLIFADWDESIAHQGRQLGAILRSHWPDHHCVLDVSCGIGTQAIALAMNGFWGSRHRTSPPVRSNARAAKRRSAGW